mmetsp:Transcript_76645/g.242343  ORF Transcript_76645/g.242343 Transcript_76645/m.242343 type:complete len:271 (+) Transcript_76645:732-1544(+)
MPMPAGRVGRCKSHSRRHRQHFPVSLPPAPRTELAAGRRTAGQRATRPSPWRQRRVAPRRPRNRAATGLSPARPPAGSGAERSEWGRSRTGAGRGRPPCNAAGGLRRSRGAPQAPPAAARLHCATQTPPREWHPSSPSWLRSAGAHTSSRAAAGTRPTRQTRPRGCCLSSCGAPGGPGGARRHRPPHRVTCERRRPLGTPRRPGASRRRPRRAVPAGRFARRGAAGAAPRAPGLRVRRARPVRRRRAAPGRAPCTRSSRPGSARSPPPAP